MTRRRRIRARDRRALLLGLIIVAPVAAYRVGIQPWLAYRSGLSDALQAERDLLVREQGALATADKLPEHIDTLQQQLGQADEWLPEGGSQMAVAGELTRYVTSTGQASAILIQQAETRNPDDTGEVVRPISLSIRALGDLEGLIRFLHRLENGAYLVRVDELTLRPAGVNDGDLERGQLMSAGLVVTAYWLAETAAAEALSFAGAAPEARP